MDMRADAETAGPVRPMPRVAGTERLIRDHAGLVRRIAWQTHARISSAIDVDDLVQTGMVALTEAASHFVDRGEAAFGTYASVRVRGAMLDALRKQAPLNRGAMRRRRALLQAKTEAASAGDGAPASVAERLGVTPEQLARLEVDTQPVRQESLDHVYSDHDAVFAADHPDALDNLCDGRLRSDLAKAIARLPQREALVLQLYFVEELNLEQIGQVLGVGAARVCQIKKVALDKLRAMLAAWR